MTNCAKCGAELIGSRKFCAACGAPTDPSAFKRSDPNAGPPSQPAPQPAPQINVPSTAYGPPGPPVNPFAATASPSSRAVVSSYGPPPAGGPPPTTANPPSGAPPGNSDPASLVSPLAVSNALSQRGAFQQAAGDRIPPPPQSSPTGPAPPPPKKAPGTQLMPSIPNPSLPQPSTSGSSPPGSASATPSKPPPQRTQLMDASAFVRPTPSRQSAPNQPIATPQSAQSPIAHTPVMPPSVPHQPAAPVPPVASPMAPYVAPPVAPPAAAQWGAPASAWGAPAPAAVPAAPYGFGYAPGARVNVTWSNGQRYPATISQISGTQCLVVFPDGQQHWVEMQYLSPG